MLYLFFLIFILIQVCQTGDSSKKSTSSNSVKYIPPPDYKQIMEARKKREDERKDEKLKQNSANKKYNTK